MVVWQGWGGLKGAMYLCIVLGGRKNRRKLLKGARLEVVTEVYDQIVLLMLSTDPPA